MRIFLDSHSVYIYYKVVYIINYFAKSSWKEVKMEQLTNNQIEKVMEDISWIKSILNQNKRVIRLIMLPTHFKWSYLVLGSGLIGFSLLYHLLMEHYGSFALIPRGYKNGIYFLIFLVYLILGVLRLKVTRPSLMRLDERYTLGFLAKEMSAGIVHVFLPLIVLVSFMGVFLGQRDATYYMVPSIALCMGVIHNYIGSITRIWQWFASGYWFLVTGVYFLYWGPAYVPFAVSVSLGCGSLLYFVFSWISPASREMVAPANS